MRSAILAAAACLAGAQTWYGIAPDGGDPGLINLFAMEPNGLIISDRAPIKTSDREYPKTGTLHCSWNSPTCFFATGVQARGVEDSVYGVDRTTGAIKFKHTAPPGIYFDNLVFDWAHEDLYYVTFNTNDRRSSIVKLNAATGNITYVFDISKDTAAGAVFPGQVSMCSQLQELYVGIDARDGEDLDFVLRYDVSGATPVLKAAIPLLFPLPTSTFAICNSTDLQALYANTIQVDGFDKETALLGDVIKAGKEGLFYPVSRGDLPSYNRRGGQAPKYFNGMIAEFGGEFILPAYEPFQDLILPRPDGLIWNVKFGGGRAIETLTPIGYFLAGASGVPA